MRSGALRALGLALLAATLPGGIASAARFEPPEHVDSHDDPASPLDIRAVRFGQSGLRVILSLRTQGSWRTRRLDGNHSLCVRIDAPKKGDLCVALSGHRTVLRFQDVLADGGAGTVHAVAGVVTRPNNRTVRASFPVTELELPLGSLTWSARSSWHNDSCPTGCVDRAPDRGAFRTTVSVLAEPHCFGAAARDALHPCTNVTLDRVVYPRPAAAYTWPNSPCRPSAKSTNAVFDPCVFGVASRDARATFAIIGDSHAIHWRGALQVVASAERWRGISITRAGCPFSTQIPRSPALGPGACAQLHQQTLTWLRAHPSVRTVFVSDWAEPASGPQGGTAGYGGGPAQFGAMLDQLPASVARVFVLRDIPATSLSAVSCVRQRQAAHSTVRNQCWTSRSAAVTSDPGAAAAQARRPRAHVIDLTRFFCSASRCYAVVGGVYVYKDDNHMNDVFSTTLGPFVLRALGAE